ncbi:MAG: polyphenol oxidase family protein [Solirubrobacteraceae bacterium]
MNSIGAGVAPSELMFDLPGGGRALFTTRAHGNMSSVGGLDHEHGLSARERLRTQLRLRRLARGYQVHGTTVRCIHSDANIPAPDTDAAQSPIEADGHATCIPGIGVMALAADCLPVALGGERAVAMVHAGWRGLAAGVLEQGVLALRTLGVEGDIAAIIGPGAGPCCYEVGPEVHGAFAPKALMAEPDILDSTEAGGSPIDLRAIARERLRAVGVTDVQDLALCTICDARFYSHRREATRAGRQAGIAWLA